MSAYPQRSAASRGILSALGALVASAAVFFLAHEGMNRTTLPVFIFYWYVLSLPYFAALAWFRPETSPFRVSARQPAWAAAYLICEISSVLIFFYAMRILPPAVASFAGPTNVLFSVVLGVLILKERFILAEMWGGVLIIIGMTLIVYTAERGSRLGFTLIVLSNLLWASAHICVKKLVASVDPLAIAHARAILFAMMGILFLAVTRTSPLIEIGPLFCILAVGALVGPFLNMALRYHAVSNLEVSKVALISAQHPVVVFGITVALGQSPPGLRETAGGFLALAGSVALIAGRLRAEKKRGGKEARAS